MALIIREAMTVSVLCYAYYLLIVAIRIMNRTAKKTEN